MPKVLRLFLKDVRHLWPEILLSLLLTVGFAATAYRNWPAFHTGTYRQAAELFGWIVVLLLLSWAVLIARVVQDESLVGSRQFWVTRPYGWASILGSKLVFIACFILLPYFFAQCFLVLKAGLSPTRVLPSLLLVLCIIFLLGVLPIIAISTISSNIGQIILIILGVAVYGGIATYLVNLLFNAPGWRPHSDDAEIYLFLFIPIICAAVILVQYAIRRTDIAIALLLTVVALGTALSAIDAKTYWLGKAISPLVTGEEPPLRLTLLPPDPNPSTSPDSIQPDSPLALKIPLQAAVSPGHMVIISGHNREWSLLSESGQPVLLREEGWTPEGRWNRYNSDHLMQGDILSEEVLISHDELALADHAMISLHVSYAVDEYEPVPTNVVTANDTIDLPENGHCVTISNLRDEGGEETGAARLVCMYAGHSPTLTHVQYSLRQNCSAGASAEDLQQDFWFGDGDTYPEPAWSGVNAQNFGMDSRIFSSKRGVLTLCPGEPISFTRFHLLRRRIISVTFPSLDPEQYRTFHPSGRM